MNSPFPSRLQIDMPAWLVDELGTEPRTFADDEAKMRFVHHLADRNHRHQIGGPFAAIVVDPTSGDLVSAGVNVVLSSNLSSCHAEVMALSLAQARRGTWDLGADSYLELVVNWRPCIMCYGAVIWSGVRRLVVAGSGPELERITGFDEGPPIANWQTELEQRQISVTVDVMRDEALAVFESYAAREDIVVYNARGGGRRDKP